MTWPAPTPQSNDQGWEEIPLKDWGGIADEPVCSSEVADEYVLGVVRAYDVKVN